MTTTLKFAGTLDPSIALVIAIVAAIIVFVIYRAETKGMFLLARWLLPVLRSVAVLLVIFLLAGPVIESARRIGNIGQVTFVVDRSTSMQHMDASRGISRQDRITNLLDGDSGLLNRLKLTHDVELVTSTENSLQTDLSTLLEDAASNVSSSNNTETQRTIVMISDGQHNAGESPVESVGKLAESGFAVATWGFGEDTEPQDLAILGLQYPDRISASGRIRGSVQYKISGSAEDGGDIQLLIRDEKGVVQWETNVAAADTIDGKVDFEFPIERLVEDSDAANDSLKRDLVRVKLFAEIRKQGMQTGPSTEEADTTNNQRPLSFLAVRSDYKLLIVDGRSRWETRYLKNLFSRDPQWTTNAVIFANESSSVGSTPTGNRQSGEASGMPRTLEQLLDYDLVCIGEVPPGAIDKRFLQWLTDYVARGGGLVLIDGQRGHVQQLFGEQFQQLVPVDWTGAPKPFFADRLERTSEGKSTAWLSLTALDDQNSNSDAWRSLPAPRTMRLVSAAKDAETLVEASLGKQKVPLVVTRTFGGGRIVYFASDETWRWRYKRADEIHSKFWNQLALALLQPPLAIGNQYAELDVDKAEYESGESATVRVRLRSEDGAFKSDASVEATLIRDGQPVQSFVLQADGRLPGMYSGQSSELEAGEYTLRFSAAEYGQVSEQLTASFSVLPQASLEQLRLSQNSTLLRELATNGSGQYFAESEIEQLTEYLMQRTGGKIEVTRTSLWDSYYWFIPVIFLLAVEWWLRKRWGLP